MAEHIVEYFDYFTEWMSKHTLARHVRALRCRGTWGSFLEVEAASKILATPIVVHRGRMPAIAFGKEFDGAPSCSMWDYIMNLHGVHFQLIGVRPCSG